MFELDFVLNLMMHVSALLGVGMFIFVWRQSRHSSVRSAFLILLGVVLLWNFGTLLELDFRLLTGETYMLFVNICYIGICLSPIAILYLGRVILEPEWHIRRVHYLFLVIPFVSIIMVLTDPLHHQFFVNFSLHSSEAVYGAYYYFHSFYSYGCICAGIVLMYIASGISSGFFSKQSWLVILGVVSTLVPNLLYSSGIVSLPFGISAAAFTISILCFSVAFLKYRFIDALPISLKQVVELISDGYLVVDKQMHVLSYNRIAAKMLPNSSITAGEDLRAVIGRYAVDDDDCDRIMERFVQAIDGQETVSFEERFADGRYVNVEVTPVKNRHIYLGSIILLEDITESKLLIDATLAASQAKGDFLSQMSHEIRTPLNAIIGMINIGMHSDDIDRMRLCFERADNASKHLLSIINDILDMSKIEADKFELSYGEFEFKTMLTNTVSLATVLAEEKKQKVTVEISEDVPALIGGDELRLSQVITNLLTNAVKFTPEEGSIIVRAAKEDEQDGVVTLRIEVEDTGIGISEEQQVRLFTRYNQADANTTKNFGGTGLGLAISKRIVELMSGTIWLSSEVEVGSKFTFTIKVKKLAEIADNDYSITQDTALNSGQTSESAEIDDFSGFTLLVAEDIEINREIVGAVLEETAISIDYAENGKVAVSMFETNSDKYDLILMDIQMPVMDGYEATETIRALNVERAKTIPIIAMTANVFKEDIERCITCGMNSHTGKPIDTNELLTLLRHYLGERP